MSAHTPGIIHREIDPLSDAGEREANSRLIAAAPDLLSACKATLKSAKYWGCDCRDKVTCRGCVLEGQLSAAIARAEGRTE